MTSRVAEKSVVTVPGMRPLLATVFLTFSGFSLLLTLSPSWAMTAGAGKLGAGAVTATLMVATILAQLRVNAALRRFGWASVMRGGLVLLAIPAPIQALAPDITVIMVSTALRGVGFGILTVCGATALTLLAPEPQRGRAVGAYGLAVALPQFAFASSAPTVASWLGTPAVLIAGALPALALTWIAPLGRRLTTLASARSAESDAMSQSSHALVVRLVWPALLALVFATSTGGAALTFAAQIAPGPGLATLTLLVLTGVAIPARWLAGAWSDRRRWRWMIPALVVCTALGAAAFSVSLAPSLASARVALLLTGSALIGMAYGGLQSATLARTFRIVGTENASRASVAWNVTFDLGTGVGALIIGVIAETSSFPAAFAVIAVAGILGSGWTRQRRSCRNSGDW